MGSIVTAKFVFKSSQIIKPAGWDNDGSLG